jgi:hypothetical protein
MCTIAAAGLVLALASTAYTTYDADQKTKAQNNINQKAADEGAALAEASFKQQAGQVRLRDQQEANAASQEQVANTKRAAAARATERVSAGESGASGVSVDNLISDFYRQEAGYKDAVTQNLEMSQAQSTQDLLGLRAGATDRAIASRRPMLERPSYLAAGIQMAGQGLDTYNRYRYTSATPSGRAA